MKLVALVALSAGLAIGVAAPASASVTAHGAVACPAVARVQCATVPVPLDRTGRVGGTVNLSAARVPAAAGPSKGTIMFLAGGPGESALGALSDVEGLASRFAPGYDVVTFDQRGTGASGALSCFALNLSGSETSVFARCGAELGAARGFYRTSDSVDDIEAVRRALGLGPVDLLGVSYGGRVAGEYVRRYPASVARLVLDSPTPLAGTDPFFVPRQQALPRVLRSVCGGGACRSFTRSSYGDLRAVARRLGRRSLRTYVVSSGGHRQRVRLSEDELYGLIGLVDLDPVGRAELPGALRSARAGDGAPLARTLDRTLSVVGGSQLEDENDGVALFAATSCAEAPLPWSPASAPSTARDAALAGRVHALGTKAFAPFGAKTVEHFSFLEQCRRWPAVAPAPVAASAGPPVPTLVLSGEEDLRTTLAGSEAVAAGYPAGRLLRIPATGHSTITTDTSLCAPRAGFRFLTTGTAPAACPRRARDIPTAVRPPTRLSRVGGKTRRAKTVRAVRLTVRDLALSILGTTSGRFGGLRGGYVTLNARRPVATLHGYTYVPGVKVSGVLRVVHAHLVGTLRVSGGGAARGQVTYRTSGKVKAHFSGAGASAVLDAGGPVRLPERPERAPRALR
jgi:pimeloyl-ACP methyl ester carboxylesterase